MTIFMKIRKSQNIYDKNGKLIHGASMDADFDGTNAHIKVSNGDDTQFTKISKKDINDLLSMKSNKKPVMEELLKISNEDGGNVHRRHHKKHHAKKHRKHHKHHTKKHSKHRKHHTKKHRKHHKHHTKKHHKRHTKKHRKHHKKHTKKHTKTKMRSKIKKLLNELF